LSTQPTVNQFINYDGCIIPSKKVRSTLHRVLSGIPIPMSGEICDHLEDHVTPVVEEKLLSEGLPPGFVTVVINNLDGLIEPVVRNHYGGRRSTRVTGLKEFVNRFSCSG